MENYAGIVALLSLLSPKIVDLFVPWFLKIVDENRRKAVIFLFTVFISLGLSLIVDFLGNYNLSFETIISLGTGVSFAVGQGTYRAARVLGWNAPKEEVKDV